MQHQRELNYCYHCGYPILRLINEWVILMPNSDGHTAKVYFHASCYKRFRKTLTK